MFNYICFLSFQKKSFYIFENQLILFIEIRVQSNIEGELLSNEMIFQDISVKFHGVTTSQITTFWTGESVDMLEELQMKLKENKRIVKYVIRDCINIVYL